MYKIYKITHKTSGKAYIGQSVNPEKRWKEHCRRSSGCKKLSRAIQKYGKDAFDFEVLLDSIPNKSEADQLEKQIIWWYGSIKHGYNICPGGGGAGSGSDNPMFGKTHSEETKQKISEAHTGKKRPDYSERMSGEKNPNSKLTDLQRQEIQNLYATGNYTKTNIATLYNVSLRAIWRTINKTKELTNGK